MLKKYLSLEGLTQYNAFIKAKVDEKADAEHSHDNLYYTEEEVDEKFMPVAFIDINGNETILTEAAITEKLEEIENGTY